MKICYICGHKIIINLKKKTLNSLRVHLILTKNLPSNLGGIYYVLRHFIMET